MKFIILAAIAATIPTAFASLTINTPPSVAACEPTQLSWSGGTAPYYLSLVPASQPGATPIEQFPVQNGTTYTWNVDQAPGVSFTISLKDSTGTQAYSSIVTVQPGSSTSCLSSSGSSGGSGTASAGSAGTTAAGNTTPSETSAGSSGSASTTASSSSASSTSTKTSGAGRLSVSSAFGVAGLMGLVGAALF